MVISAAFLFFVLWTHAVSKKLPFIGPIAKIGRLKEEEYSIYSFERATATVEKERMYEAYNDLHTLAQDFKKPFDAPAVIVIGHQTSGKSALIEALMGFQFNQVGGGTKTRRPIALRMQYNPNCITPLCFLTQDDGREEQRSLADIQAFIESENKRLERDSTRSFDPREIHIRMEYRYCPNMIVIDTPGMLHPPKGRQLTAQQRALAQAAREAEELILTKLRCQDYIILCVEDTTDWKHATTRNIVMQADPQLLRTVLVTTKLDTKVPQFSESVDLEDFLKAPLVHQLYSQLLGGPFFTSVPSGRVGISKDFNSNDAFVQSLKQAEKADQSSVIARMGTVKARSALKHVGVSKLRTFLEARVEDCYRSNVAKIVPLLQTELRITEKKLAIIDEELRGLSLDHLKQLANDYREQFAKELSNVIQGSVRVSPAEWGETLDMEAMRSGSFLQQTQVQSTEWQRLLESDVGNCHHKLFGGAQYHRTMREFTVAVRHMSAPAVTEDEIANAAGMGDRHNGVNFMRAACVIAMEKAHASFEPMLEALRARSVHIMKRLYPVVEDMMSKSGTYNNLAAASAVSGGNRRYGNKIDMLSGNNVSPLSSSSAPFQQVMKGIYYRFVEQQIDNCLTICRQDLHSMTRFVTWDVEDKGGASTLYRMLPTPQKMVQIYNLVREKREEKQQRRVHYEDKYDDDDAQIDEEEEEYKDDDSLSRNSNTRNKMMPNSNNFQNNRQANGNTDRVGGKGKKTILNRKKNSKDSMIGTGAGVTSAANINSRSSNAVGDQIVQDWEKANSGERSGNGFNNRYRSNKASYRTAASISTTIDPKNPSSVPSTTVASAPTKSSNKELILTNSQVDNGDDAELSDYYSVMQLTEEMISGTSATRTSALITSLVHFIVSSWRNHFARSTAMKFNCFFLMPFIDDFPAYLRNELDRIYSNGVAEMFDIAETRRALQSRRSDLLAEYTASSKLQSKFDKIAEQLQSFPVATGTSPSIQQQRNKYNNKEESEEVDDSSSRGNKDALLASVTSSSSDAANSKDSSYYHSHETISDDGSLL